MLPSAESLHHTAVPQVVFKTRSNDAWLDVSTDSLFKGKTVIVFALPGAYTPTCSSSHLPRYHALAATFRDNGVDDIICMSVNDAFVMNEWQAGQDAGNITFIPDGNGEFAAGMGLLVDKRALGFGLRSWRYAMLVKDGVIEKMFIEPDRDDDPLEVSDADTMLRYVNPEAVAPAPVLIFAKPGCPHCARAKALLHQHGLVYSEVTMSQHLGSEALLAVSGKATWPQVFIGGVLIGDADALTIHLAAHHAPGAGVPAA